MVAVVAACVLTGIVLAQQRSTGRIATQIDRIATDEIHRQHIPGMTVAVALDDHVVYSKGFGTADLENGVTMTSDTLIRTGSLAKPITAAAAMTLVDAHKLDLDAPVQKYCNAFPVKAWPVTTRELLTHTSGIRHYRGDEADSTKHYPRMSDGFAIFSADPLLFEPGTKYSYSTYGYTVVGCVIEGASGQPYFDYLREHVLIPADMTHTFVDDVFAIEPHRSRGYHTIHDHLQNAGLVDSSYKIPGGGLVSTAEDMVRLDMALMEGRVVKPATLETMWTPTGLPRLEDGKRSSYGIGFGVLNLDGQKYIAHSGGLQGASTDMEVIPGRRFAVAVLTNDEDAEPFDVIRPILDLYHMPRPKPANK